MGYLYLSIVHMTYGNFIGLEIISNNVHIYLAYLQMIKLLVLLLVLDAQVFKQLSRLTKVQVESLSTNAQKFTTTEFSERLLNSFKGPDCLTNFRLIGRKVQHAYARPVPFNCNDFSLYSYTYRISFNNVLPWKVSPFFTK